METIQSYYKDRMYNARNSYQGNFKKVLCVCSAGILRSATTAWILSREPYNCNTRNCGINETYALIVLDQILIEWADHIIFAEKEHYDFAKENFQLCSMNGGLKPYTILEIPDNYSYRNPELVLIIENLLKHHKLDKILTSN